MNLSSSLDDILIDGKMRDIYSQSPSLNFHFDLNGYDFEMETEFIDFNVSALLSDLSKNKTNTLDSYSSEHPSLVFSVENTTLTVDSNKTSLLPQVDLNLSSATFG